MSLDKLLNRCESQRAGARAFDSSDTSRLEAREAEVNHEVRNERHHDISLAYSCLGPAD